MCVQLKSGSTDLSEEINFKSIGTSNTTVTLEADTLPSAAQLADMVLECTVGYYGGAINGATAYVTYTLTGAAYTYTFTVSGDTVIAVVISSGQTQQVYVKVSGAWVLYGTVYKKSSSWTAQADASQAFDSQTNYMHGGA